MTVRGETASLETLARNAADLLASSDVPTRSAHAAHPTRRLLTPRHPSLLARAAYGSPLRRLERAPGWPARGPEKCPPTRTTSSLAAFGRRETLRVRPQGGGSVGSLPAARCGERPLHVRRGPPRRPPRNTGSAPGSRGRSYPLACPPSASGDARSKRHWIETSKATT